MFFVIFIGFFFLWFKLGMSEKKKKATHFFIRLLLAADTGFYYVKKKPKRVQEALEFRKYDHPRVNRHVLFREVKMDAKQ